MRRLTLQSKRFPRINSPFHLPRIIGLLVVTAALTTISCRMRQQLAAKSDTFTRSWLTFSLESNGNAPGPVLARLDARYCEPETQGNEVWEVGFQSPFGPHQVTLNYAFAAAGDAIHTTIDGDSYLIPLTHPFPDSDMTKACQEAAQGNMEHKVADASVVAALQSVLSRVAPGCTFDRPTEKGWVCNMAATNPTQSLERLNEVRRVMVLRWSRHPYLLTRRVALSISLAQALASNAPGKELDQFCKILTFSLPEELPLALRTRTWQERVCKKPTENRIAIATIGLRDSETEIQTLKQELESTSRLGTLSIRIPTGEAPTKDYWITLSPISPEQTEAKVSEGRDTPPVQLCWHPLYHENDGFKTISAELGLYDPKTANHCRQTIAVNRNNDQIERHYILSSITSESEFPISNFQSKLLRLPEGEYQYTLQQHLPEDPWEAPPASEISQGTISWKTLRPRSVINKW